MRQRATLTAAAAVVALSVSARAEQVVLKSGGRVNGILLERTPTHVVMQVGPGQVTIPLASIERVVEGRSPLAVFAERASRLSGIDREGWLDLALWAREAGLETQARECFARVLALEPQNPTAHAALGDVLLNGRWVDPEEAYRARGYVRFEGSWMLPEERDERLRERAEQREVQRARAEERVRVQEAEARAREAEAAARAAEAAASGYGYGMPIGYYDGYGTIVGGGPVVGRPEHPIAPGRPGRPGRPGHVGPPRPRPTTDTGSTRSSSGTSGNARAEAGSGRRR